MVFSTSVQAEQQIARICHEAGWQIAAPEWADFWQTVHACCQKSAAAVQAEVAAIAANCYHDRATVQIALDSSHPEYESTWQSITAEIVGWLEKRRYFPPDETTLNEFSPDICAYALLREHLHEFRYGCRLSTYIQVITERACRQWLRSLATLKRGGSGISSATERRCADPQRRAQAYRICYLSQSPSFEPTLRWEDVLPNENIDLIGIAESQALVDQVEAAVLAMTDDRHYALICQIWRPMLLERANVTALAQQAGVQQKVLFNLKKRLVRRIGPILSAWRQSH